jgi:hypothetical protein
MLRPACLLPVARLAPPGGLLTPRSGTKVSLGCLGPATRRSDAYRDGTLTRWTCAACSSPALPLRVQPSFCFVTHHASVAWPVTAGMAHRRRDWPSPLEIVSMAAAAPTAARLASSPAAARRIAPGILRASSSWAVAAEHGQVGTARGRPTWLGICPSGPVPRGDVRNAPCAGFTAESLIRPAAPKAGATPALGRRGLSDLAESQGRDRRGLYARRTGTGDRAAAGGGERVRAPVVGPAETAEVAVRGRLLGARAELPVPRAAPQR